MDDPNSVNNTVLNFCRPCGELRLKDVKDQLQRLFTTQCIQVNSCGICCKILTPTINLRRLTRRKSAKEAKCIVNDGDEKDKREDNDDRKDKREDSGDRKDKRENNGDLKDKREDNGDLKDKREDSDANEDDDSVDDNNDDDVDFEPDEQSSDAASDTDPDFEPSESNTTKIPTRSRYADSKHSKTNNRESQHPSKQYNGTSGVHPKLLEMMKPARNPKRPFNCKLCENEDHDFGFLLAFQKHLKTHTGEEPIEEPYYCEQCKMTFLGRATYKSHMFRVHSKEKPLKCPHEDCKAAFVSTSEFNMHKATHTDYKPFTCKQCKKGFRTRSALKIHGRYHTGTRHYVCTYCKKGFFTKRSKIDHETLHTGVKPFQCKQCPYTCRLIKMLVSHEQSHNRPTMQCDRCKYVFKSQILLGKHQKINKCRPPRQPKIKVDLMTPDAKIDISYITECLDKEIVESVADPVSQEKPFKCKVCKNKLFRNPGSFIKHVSRHMPDGYNESKPFKCPDCGSRFKGWHKLEAHRLVHITVRSIKCPHPGCEAAFKSTTHMWHHTRCVHSEVKPHMCEICGTTFNTSSKLKSHSYSHTEERPIKCSECDKTFKYSGKLRAHERRVHKSGPLLMCEQCGKAFKHRDALTNHIRVHTAVKRFACPYCDYKCKRRNNLPKHTKIHFRTGAAGSIDIKMKHTGLDTDTISIPLKYEEIYDSNTSITMNYVEVLDTDRPAKCVDVPEIHNSRHVEYVGIPDTSTSRPLENVVVPNPNPNTSTPVNYVDVRNTITDRPVEFVGVSNTNTSTTWEVQQ